MPVAELGPWRAGYDSVGSGEPVLLLSGLGFDRAGAAMLAQTCAEAGYRAITLDNPGAGETEGPPGPFTGGQLAGVAAALLDHLEAGPTHLLGVSMGGLIAQELAVARPDLVRSLQLHCTWGRTDPFLAALFASWAELVQSVGPVAVWDHLLLWAMTPGFYGAHPEVVAGYRALIAGGPPSSAAGFRAQAAACIAHDALSRLGAVTAPALVATGEHDLITTPRHAQELLAAVPHAALHLFPGVGHLPFAESPAAFDELVLAFLASA